jgi:hypothetical protein
VYLIFPTDASQMVRVKLAALSADTITTNISAVPGRCYTNYVLNSVSLDGKILCTACNEPQLVTIAK